MINSKYLAMIKQFLRPIRPIRSYFKQIDTLKILFTKRYLIFTNTGLSIVTSVFGDLIQQSYQRVKNDKERTWDAARSAKIAAVGLAFGPTVHYWYMYLDKVLPGKTKRTVLIKLCLDQFIFSPFCISIFLIIVGLLEQQGLQLLKDEFRETGFRMFITDMAIWTPAQAVNFYFVPVKYRVLYDSTVSLMVDTFYSYLRFERDKVNQEKNSDFQMDKGNVVKPVNWVES